MSDARRYCFVLMPFGTKPDPTGGREIDFDRIYESAIHPAIESAGLEPIRADEERSGGIIHKAMFERLLLCRFAVADLTTANANVFYELGVRHAVRPRTTVAIYAASHPLPFDLNHLRGICYELGENNEFGASEAGNLRDQLAEFLAGLMESETTDSPIFDLLTGWRVPAVDDLQAESFSHREERHATLKARIQRARMKGRRAAGRSDAVAALEEIRADLGPLEVEEIGVILDLVEAHRSVGDWGALIRLCEDLPGDLKRQAKFRQQLAMAYNRRAEASNTEEDREEALRILEQLESEQGASGETCGLIGRIHKGRWMQAVADEAPHASGFLKLAIEAYRRGFEADWRDVFPGVNLVTLLALRGDEASRAQSEQLLPIVRYAAERRMDGTKPHYWDFATALELAVLEEMQDVAGERLADAMASLPEIWMRRTTADNLGLIRDAWGRQGRDTKWLDGVIQVLLQGLEP